MFKKSKISSLQHLSYLWLIGNNNLEKQNLNNIYNEKIGIIYHQTLNRTKKNNIIKYIFYTRLYYKNNDISSINKIFGYDFNYLLDKINMLEIINIFYHSCLEFIGIPDNKIMITCHNDIISKKYNKNHYDAYFIKNSKILLNVNFVCFLKNKKDYNKNDIIHIEISSNDIKNITFIFYELCFNNNISIHKTEKINIDNKIIIKITLNYNTSNTIGYAFIINCNIIENNIIGTLKNVKIKNN
jgi:hypothetical protein